MEVEEDDAANGVEDSGNSGSVLTQPVARPGSLPSAHRAMSLEGQQPSRPSEHNTNGQQHPVSYTKSTQPQVDTNPVDALTNSLDALSLVPTNIRFGRGGKSGRIARQGHSHGGGGTTTTKDSSRNQNNTRDSEPTIIPSQPAFALSGHHQPPSPSNSLLSSKRKGYSYRFQVPSEAAIAESGSGSLSLGSLNGGGGADEEISINIDAALDALRSESFSATQNSAREKAAKGSLLNIGSVVVGNERDDSDLGVRGRGRGRARSMRFRGRGRGAGRG